MALLTPPAGRPRGRRGVAATLLVLAAAAAAGGAAAQPSEDEVKAAFLYSFTKFVEWPEPSLGPAEAPFAFCALGAGPLGGTLEAAVRGKRVRGRPAVVRRPADLADLGGCRILFVGGSQAGRVPEILAALRDRPVLTVGDHEGFVGAGGMVELFLRDRRVQFRVDQGAADDARLAISAKLLGLAERVLVAGRGAPIERPGALR
jgi:hypothetical protein